MESRDLTTTNRRRTQEEATAPWPGLFTPASSCTGCGRRLRKYEPFVDPRADINVYGSLSAADHGMAGPDVPACFPCINDRDPYERVLAAWPQPEAVVGREVAARIHAQVARLQRQQSRLTSDSDRGMYTK